LPLGAYADEADALKHPVNTVDFGALYSSQSSAKFGEYNGLKDEGFYGLGAFDVRGGDGYDQDKNSALRWKLNGTDLGTTSRNLGASITDQGKWKVNLGYDELQHNITDTFQTPLQGDPGANNFTLPANFGSVNGAGGLPVNTRTLTNTQLNAFHIEKEQTTRRNSSLGTSYSFTEQLSAQIDYNHLEQSGAKLIGTGAQGGINLLGGSSGRAEGNNIIMNPTNYSTDNITAALSWKGEKAHLTGGYYGSIFHDDYNSLSWQNSLASANSGCRGANCYTNETMSTAPSNSLHQANLTGGYDFTPTTKLAGGFSYGYNTQNDNYAPTSIPQANGTSYNMAPNGLPASSLNGAVETTHGDLKLTNQSIKDLTLTAGFKYNERNNHTDSDRYNYNHLGNGLYTGVNTPYSNRKTQWEAAADYRLTKSQKVRLSYEREDINRWCDGVVGGAQCVASPTSDEDKVGLTYRLKAFDDVNFNAGYSFAKRNANFDHNFQANTGNYALPGAVLHGGLNAGDYLGYVAYPYATRAQNLVKSGVNWQLTRQVDLGVNGNYKYDDYNATLGVQNGHSAGVNVDVAYNYEENSSVSAYWSWQNGQRNLRSGTTGNGTAAFTPSQTVAPRNIWTNRLEDNSNTVGLLTKNGGLLGGKLEVIGDFSYALDSSAYSTQIPYGTATACGSSASLTCGSLSPIKNELISLKLTGNYKVHKNGKLALAYIYQKLNSNDYFYNGTQFGGYTPNRVMPTGLREQDYTVNVVALSYSLAF
ncbi:MAG: MtrB/PioB family decaheme-associated outer membrane protein, partial [Methylococcaceae bacterium]